MANIYDYINNVADKDGLITGINYNMQESPTTSAYHQIAAQDNPDYAQAIGDIYRYGDINRVNFNLGMNVLAGLNNKKYLEKVQKEQRAYAEQLADKKFEQQKELVKLKNMFALRNLAPRLSAPRTATPNNTYINSKGETIERPEDYKYTIAEEIEQKDLPKAQNLYTTEGFSGSNINNYNQNIANDQKMYLDLMYNALNDPQKYPGTSKIETNYLMNKLINDYINKVNAYNAQQKQLIENSNRDVDEYSGNNYITNKILELEDPYNPSFGVVNNKNRMLKEFLEQNNARIPVNGWETSPDIQQIYLNLLNNNIDLNYKYPITNNNGEVFLYDILNGTIDEVLIDNNGIHTNTINSITNLDSPKEEVEESIAKPVSIQELREYFNG